MMEQQVKMRRESLAGATGVGSSVESQMFRDGPVVAVKEEDIHHKIFDSYYFYFSGKQVIRIEQYRMELRK
jgi:hypothetical protein